MSLKKPKKRRGKGRACGEREGVVIKALRQREREERERGRAVIKA